MRASATGVNPYLPLSEKSCICALDAYTRAMNTQKLIEICGMKDAEIARLAGVHRATVGRWRLGLQQPDTAEAIVGLARALGVKPALVRPDLAAVFGK
jgi:transcriptional regulator with XRE-family HTH domain